MKFSWPPVIIVVASVLWGTTGTAASLLPASVPGFATGSAAMGIGGALFLAVFFKRSLKALRHPLARKWIIAGGVSVFLYPLAFYTGLQAAGVAIGTVANIGSAPLFAAIIERVVSGRPLTRRWGIGAILAALGLIMLTVGTHRKHEAEGEVPGLAFGLVCALVAGLLYAAYTYTSKRAMEHHARSTGVMSATFGIGGLMLMPIVVVNAPVYLQSWETISVNAYLAVVAVFLAYWLFGIGLKKISATTATTISLIEPVTAACLAVVVVGEWITLLGWCGIGLILCSVLMESTAPPPRVLESDQSS